MSILLAVLLLCGCSVSLHAQTPTSANHVKAVFLYNFSKFVTWPPAASNSTPFVIGILGDDPFGGFMEQVVAGEKIAGHTIVIQRYSTVSEIKNCHILYINKNNAAVIAKGLGSRAILTVGEGEEFARSGGIIRFYVENNKVRLRVNTRLAKTADLQISSKLLRIADVIE